MQRFRNASTAAKLLLGFSLVAALTVIVGIAGYTRLIVLDHAVQSMYDNSTVPIRYLGQARTDFAAARGQGQQAFVDNRVPGGVDKARTTWQHYMTEIAAKMTTYRASEVRGRQAETLALWDQRFAAYQASVPKLWTLAEAHDDAGFRSYRAQVVTPAATAATDTLDALAELENESAQQAIRTANVQARNGRLLIIGAIVAALAASAGLALGISRLIARPLHRTARVLAELAEGRLDQQVEVSGRDEVGQMSAALVTALASLSSTMRQVGEAAQVLTTSAGHFTAAAGDVAAASGDVTSSAGSASAAAQQISMNVRHAAEGTDEMTRAIAEIARSASDATTVAREAVEVAQETSTSVSRLGESSEKIGEIVKTIEAIADQTNLLALNATIEAARAGESGKGFAVVANEVKDLAQETATATKDIAALVSAVQTETQAAVQSMARISAVIDKISAAQETIAGAVEEQTAVTQDISRSVGEAAAGAGAIEETISAVAERAVTVSEGAGDTRNSAAELARIASDLHALLTRFSY